MAARGQGYLRPGQWFLRIIKGRIVRVARAHRGSLLQGLLTALRAAEGSAAGPGACCRHIVRVKAAHIDQRKLMSAQRRRGGAIVRQPLVQVADKFLMDVPRLLWPITEKLSIAPGAAAASTGCPFLRQCVLLIDSFSLECRQMLQERPLTSIGKVCSRAAVV